jgi:hypothetical protein
MLLFSKGAFRKSRIARTRHVLLLGLARGDVKKKSLKNLENTK